MESQSRHHCRSRILTRYWFASARRAVIICTLAGITLAESQHSTPAQTNQPSNDPRHPKILNLGNQAPLPPLPQVRFAKQPGNSVAPLIAKAPAGQGPEEIIGCPTPRSNQPTDPFGPDQTVLPLMGAARTPLGVVPRPSPEVIKQFDQFVDRTIDPQETFDLLRDRPRLMLLKETPVRVQIGDPDVASFQLIAGNELSVHGHKVGTTILNLWFAEPNAPGRQRILS